MRWLLYEKSLPKQPNLILYTLIPCTWKRVKTLTVVSLVLGGHQAPSYMNEVASHSI